MQIGISKVLSAMDELILPGIRSANFGYCIAELSDLLTNFLVSKSYFNKFHLLCQLLTNFLVNIFSL